MRAALVSLFPAIVLVAACSAGEGSAQTPPDAASPAFAVTSPDMANGRLGSAQVYDRTGCLGSNRSPALSWTVVPGAKAYAVSMVDPDGGDWSHWGVADIPAATTALAAGAGGRSVTLPEGAIQVRNDFGGLGYGGACPPPGDAPHRYVVTVYALNTARLGVSDRTEGRELVAAARAAAIATATLTATYGR